MARWDWRGWPALQVGLSVRIQTRRVVIRTISLVIDNISRSRSYSPQVLLAEYAKNTKITTRLSVAQLI